MTENQWRMYVIRQRVDELLWPVRWQLWRVIAGCLWILRPDWRQHYLNSKTNDTLSQEWPLAVPTRWRRIITGID